MPLFRFALALYLLTTSLAIAAPVYQFDERQLNTILEDLRAWLPGAWDSYPQVWYDNNVTLPDAGAHEHWHRTFALLDAPHLGDTVFYGQINVGGRNGPVLGRSQVIYRAAIDAERNAVTIIGQPVPDAHLYQDLHRRPELWSKVTMPDITATKCVFVWRRRGEQLFGVLDARVEAGRKHGFGTCAYEAGGGQEFMADAEWVLSPDQLWLYDINLMGGVQFIGRTDRTYLRMYRATDYNCRISAVDEADKNANGISDMQSQQIATHNRGETTEFTTEFATDNDKRYSLLLLRAEYPTADLSLNDELRLTLRDRQKILGSTSAEPLAESIELTADGLVIACDSQ